MKHALSALFALAAAFAVTACASDADVDRWSAEEAATDHHEQDLLSGGGLGYSCSATRCECNPDAGRDSMDTCLGMDTVCHGAGKTITCTYPPGGPNLCSCDLAATPKVQLRSSVAVGGAVLAR